MKIQNISSGVLPVAVSFMTAAGESISVTLGQGEFVYTDSNIATKSIVILMKKRHIKTIEVNKPDNVEYFKVYPYGTQESESSSPQPVAPKSEERDSTLDKYKGQFRIPMITKPLIKVVPPPPIEEGVVSETPVPTQEPIIILEQTPITQEQPVIAKNKGGRPKGSKDTVKRGEEKLKKPAGRPINTEALQGKSKDEVIAKCESRGYAVRITNEDGRAYMITHDYRIDRVELQIENGIVTKANIG